MNMKIIKLAAFAATFFLLISCANGPQPVSSNVNTGGSSRTQSAGGGELDNAIREISDYFNKRIPRDSKAVFLNIKSDWPDLSEYILSGLMENAVNDDLFTIVDRRQLDLIRSELNFQWSGEVSDASAQEIGQLLGAQSIISGSITMIGSIYRIQVRSIAVQTAALQGQFTRNVDSKGNFVEALTKRVVRSGSSIAATTSGANITGAGGPKTSMLGNDELDIAIRDLAEYLNRRIPQGNKVVFLNVKCDWPEFSEYILSGLIENVVNGETLSIVDRRQLDDLRAELKFQYSGEVSDASAQEIGQLLGAQTIVSGLVTEVGSDYRIQVRAISVQTAALQGLSSRNVNSKGPVVTALTTAPAAAAALAAKKEEDERKRKEAERNKKQEVDWKKQEADRKKQETEWKKREEAERKKQEAERRRYEAERAWEDGWDKFLENSGINIGGWLGLNFAYSSVGGDNLSSLSGGADLELRLFRYFGIQSGFEIFKDMDEPKDDPLFSITQTILQVPVLARITIPVLGDYYYLSIYGGLGFNFPIDGSTNDYDSSQAAIQSAFQYSYIVGGDVGLNLNGLQIFIGYQFNSDLSDTEYFFQGKKNNYLGQRSLLNVGIRYLIPFRKEE